MPTKQSKFFKGMARIPVASAHKAGDAQEYAFTHVFTEAVLTTDVLEIFPVFPNGKIVALDWDTENIGAINLNMGFLTGTSGDTVAARTCGSELFSAVAANAAVASKLCPLLTLAPLDPSQEVRSIGLVPAADITAAANKKLHMRIRVVG